MNQATGVRERLSTCHTASPLKLVAQVKRPRRLHMTDDSLPNGWRMVHFRDVAESRLGKMLDKQKNKGALKYYLRNPNVQWFDVDTSDLQMMPFVDGEEGKYGLKAGDVVICEGGAAGRAAIWDDSLPDMMIQKAIHRVRCSDELFNRYLVYQLKIDYESGALSEYYTGTTIKHLTGQDLAEYRFPLPPLAEQRRIAGILDAADAIRRKRQQAIALTEKFLRSTFLDMFGDPVTNPKGWPAKPLGELARVQSGVTKGKKLGGKDTTVVPYMRVANVQDGHLVLDEIKNIEVLRSDAKKFLLQDGDVLLTEGGDFDKLGRGTVWHGEVPNCIHQNHIFNVRPLTGSVQSDFFSALIGSNLGKRYFLRAAKQTTGIATINKTQLSEFPTLLPPEKLQAVYADVVLQHKRLEAKLANRTNSTDNLFNSLVQRAFRGEL